MAPLVLLGCVLVTISGCAQSSGRVTASPVPAAPSSAVPAETSAAATPVSAAPIHVVQAPQPAKVAPAPVAAAPANVPDLIVYPEQLAPASAPYPYVILPDDPNPRAQSILEAHRTKQFPERLTPLVAPKPFDRAAWERDPQSYVNVVEPGRVEQSSNDPAATPIRALDGHRMQQVSIGSRTVLRVQALPYAPVSWVTTSGGLFTESKVGAVTVRADVNGIAQVTFYATPGLSGGTSILAASPFCGGQAEQLITFPVAAPPPAAASH
ncbi:MAG: hypothetical protein AAB263_05980 [Planctomycetota bacterium]